MLCPVIALVLDQSMLFKPSLNAVDGPLQPDRHILYTASLTEHLHEQFILFRIPGKTAPLLSRRWNRTSDDALAIRQAQKHRSAHDNTRAAKKVSGHLFIGCTAAVSMAQISPHTQYTTRNWNAKASTA